MAVRMVALNKLKNGPYLSRKVIPVDVRDAYARLHGVQREAQLRQPSDTPRHEAKARHAEWLADVETRIEGLRAQMKGAGQPLTRLNAIALAGRWYNWFVKQHEEDPGTPQYWRSLSDTFVWNVLRPEAPEEFEENPKGDPEWMWTKDPEVRANIRPLVAEQARVATFLSIEGLALDDSAHALFVDAVADNLLHAFTLLERRASGDYTPDTTPESFPAFANVQGDKGNGLNCWQLFEAFVNATRPADGTVQRWRAVFLSLDAEFPDAPAAAIAEADARGWVKKLVSPDRSATTVREVWLPASRRVFGWGVDHKHVRQNPFTDIKVDVPRRTRSRETKAFRPDEATVILRASLAYTQPRTARERARRWAMWLCAYSGARAGEITQLRGIDVKSRGDFYSMDLTPDAGPIKTRQMRIVPIHAHIIEQGFLDMVQEIGSGPLFYYLDETPRVDVDPLKPPRSRAGTARAQLSDWVRELGVKDPEVSPTHGWRHTFKQTADRAGIPEKVHDAITGHTPPSEGRKYGAPTVEDMADALKKFPQYRLD